MFQESAELCFSNMKHRGDINNTLQLKVLAEKPLCEKLERIVISAEPVEDEAGDSLHGSRFALEPLPRSAIPEEGM